MEIGEEMDLLFIAKINLEKMVFYFSEMYIFQEVLLFAHFYFGKKYPPRK